MAAATRSDNQVNSWDIDIMKVTGLFIFAVFGMASAELIGGDSHHHAHDLVGPTTPGPLPFPNTGKFPITLRSFILTAAKLDGHVYIFRTGVLIMQGIFLEYGEYGEKNIVSGFLTTETGHRVSVDGGLLYGQMLHPRNTEAIRRALSRTDMTIEHFSQQTGVSSPKKVYDVISGVISINGIYRNINSAVTFILTADLTKPVTKSHGLSLSLATGNHITVPRFIPFGFVVAKLDGHVCIFMNGSLLMQGPPLEIGDDGVFQVISGFLTKETGHRVSVDGGLLYIRGLDPRKTEAIRSALSRADTTLEYLIKHTEFNSHTQIVGEVTSGVMSISGTYRNVNAVLLYSVLNVTESGTKSLTVVTETATPETLTLSQPVTLTKTSTIDEYTTITSPVYNSVVATYTNFVRQTVTVPEEQVIRSPIAGRVVVNTIPVTTQLVLTVTDTATNYFVSTGLETVTSTLQHFSSRFSIKTIMVNNIITSTVVHTITRTSIATTYITNTVGSTVYSTTAVTVIISHGSATTEAFPVYY